ncbi:DNA alkylation repair enzyme family protein [Streptococcus mitis]|nr:hypothetical protein HMPREF1110_1828 [Streptococcus mitis SK579]MDK7102593.1 DNA alkylation repair enzyme family protein [Streptococcus mitis]
MSLTDLLEELEAAEDPKKAGPMESYMRHYAPSIFLSRRCGARKK